MFNMKKMKKILAFCLCAMLMTTVPTFTETASAATTSTKKDNIHNNKEKDHDQRLVQTQNRWNEIFQKRQIHYRLS